LLNEFNLPSVTQQVPELRDRWGSYVEGIFDYDTESVTASPEV
jgi:hypothetical protein